MIDLNQQLTLHIQGLPIKTEHHFQEIDETPLDTPGITIKKIGGYIPQRMDLILYGEEQSYMSKYDKGNLSLYPIEDEVDNSILNGNKIRFYIPKLRFALGTSRGYVCIYPLELTYEFKQEDITYSNKYVEIELVNL